MYFQLIPVIDLMIEMYQQPRDANRFKDYLKLLQGDTKNDLDLPITYFNPMAKEHVLNKLIGLKELDIETIARQTLDKLNLKAKYPDKEIFKVVVALADDAKGGWTNRYTTDYDSKFKLNPLLKRHFCNPVFWVSEDIDNQIIEQRVLACCYRTIYAAQHPKPQTLADHLLQEKFVNENLNEPVSLSSAEATQIQQYYQQHKNTTDYPVIINLLYGDKTAVELGYTPIGITTDMAGFRFARMVG